MQKLLPLFALSLAVAGSALGATYTDDFSTNPGALNGRTTAAGFGNWIAAGDLSTGSGTGIYESGSAAYPTASFQMPTLDTASQISISFTMKPVGTSQNNFIAFGFTNLPQEYITQRGSALALMFGPGSTETPGVVAVASGLSLNGDTVYYANPFASFNGALATTLTMDYSVGSGLMVVTASNNGQTVTVFNGLAGWTPTSSGPGADNPVPYQTYMNYFTIQFENQNPGLSGGNISNLTVSVVPEPGAGTYILGAAAAFGVVALIRRRRAALLG